MTPSGEEVVKERFSQEFNVKGDHPKIEIENGP